MTLDELHEILRMIGGNYTIKFSFEEHRNRSWREGGSLTVLNEGEPQYVVELYVPSLNQRFASHALKHRSIESALTDVLGNVEHTMKWRQMAAENAAEIAKQQAEVMQDRRTLMQAWKDLWK